jgi:hypothetical protein
MKAQAFICGKYADLVINGQLEQQKNRIPSIPV